MLEIGGELDLGQKAVGADHGGQLGPEHLEGHAAVVPDVLGQIDGGHAAGTDLPIQAVAVREGGLEPAEQFGHGQRLCGEGRKMRWAGRFRQSPAGGRTGVVSLMYAAGDS